jgi:hypothetical protein
MRKEWGERTEREREWREREQREIGRTRVCEIDLGGGGGELGHLLGQQLLAARLLSRLLALLANHLRPPPPLFNQRFLST